MLEAGTNKILPEGAIKDGGSDESTSLVIVDNGEKVVIDDIRMPPTVLE